MSEVTISYRRDDSRGDYRPSFRTGWHRITAATGAASCSHRRTALKRLGAYQCACWAASPHPGAFFSVVARADDPFKSAPALAPDLFRSTGRRNSSAEAAAPAASGISATTRAPAGLRRAGPALRCGCSGDGRSL